MYAARFNYLFALLALVAAAGITVGFGEMMMSFNDPIYRSVEVPAPGLTSSSTLEDARSRFEMQPVQTMPGANVGLPADACPTVDIYQLKDAAVLVCHG